MKIADDVRLSIANTCYAIVSGRFADMVNRNNRGDKFDWMDFPDDIAERCAAELFLYIDFNGYSEEEKALFMDTAKTYGKNIAANLLDRSGLAGD